MINHPNRSQYVTTRPVPSRHMGAIENLIPSWCRSVECMHGETDDDPVRYRMPSALKEPGIWVARQPQHSPGCL